MTRTAAATRIVNDSSLPSMAAAMRPLIRTSSIILSTCSKTQPIVELTTDYTTARPPSPAVPQDKTLRHQRTLKPSDFEPTRNGDPNVGRETPKSPVVMPASLLQATRDAPPAPEPVASTVRRRTASPDNSAQARDRSAGSALSSPTSRSLRREKTLMPEDFHQARKSPPASPPPIPAVPSTAPSPTGSVKGSDLSSRPKQGFVQITLGPSADDKKRYTRSPTDMRHYTVWQDLAEFSSPPHRTLAISADTAVQDVYQIQGVLLFSAFEDRSRNGEHPDSIYNVSDIVIELQSFSKNQCAYAKETADAPAYVDCCDTSGMRRKEDTLIKIAFDVNDKKRRSGGAGRGYAAPVSCAFGLGIPMHLFKAARERYFRVTARIEFEVASRHPLSYTSGMCRHAPVKFAYAMSDPVDFTISHLILPRTGSGSP